MPSAPADEAVQTASSASDVDPALEVDVLEQVAQSQSAVTINDAGDGVSRPPASEPVGVVPVPGATTIDDRMALGSAGTDASVVVTENPPAADCINLRFTSSKTELLQFVRLDDFVPCDFNADGIVDLLAFNQRLSTGFGYEGIGNGLFREGPSFDLPFRPASASAAGAPLDNALFLASSEGTVSLFRPFIVEDPPTSVSGRRIHIVHLGNQGDEAPLALVAEDAPGVEVYQIVNGVLQSLGKYQIRLMSDLHRWRDAVLVWNEDSRDVPVPDWRYMRRSALANLDREGQSALIYLDGASLVIEPLGCPDQTQILPLAGEVVSLRTADVDGNGYEDILILLASGVVEVWLAEFGDTTALALTRP